MSLEKSNQSETSEKKGGEAKVLTTVAVPKRIMF
jgi:hypothetical protein